MKNNCDVQRIVRTLCTGLKTVFVDNCSMDAILFGSYARGDAEYGSDIDVMVLVNESREEIAKRTWQIGDVVAEILLEDGILVSPIVENKNYFEHNSDCLPLFKNIVSEGIRMPFDNLRKVPQFGGAKNGELFESGK